MAINNKMPVKSKLDSLDTIKKEAELVELVESIKKGTLSELCKTLQKSGKL